MQSGYDLRLQSRTAELEAHFNARLVAMRAELEAQYGARIEQLEQQVCVWVWVDGWVVVCLLHGQQYIVSSCSWWKAHQAQCQVVLTLTLNPKGPMHNIFFIRPNINLTIREGAA